MLKSTLFLGVVSTTPAKWPPAENPEFRIRLVAPDMFERGSSVIHRFWVYWVNRLPKGLLKLREVDLLAFLYGLDQSLQPWRRLRRTCGRRVPQHQASNPSAFTNFAGTPPRQQIGRSSPRQDRGAQRCRWA